MLEHLSDGVAAGLEVLSMPETEILDPGAIPALPIPTPGAATDLRTLPLSVTMDIGSGSRERTLIPRAGRTTYELTFRNISGEPVDLRLQATDPDEALSFAFPETVTVPPRAGTTVTMTVTPRERQIRGQQQLRQFSVRADSESGAAPLLGAGEFDDRPEGLIPYLAPLGLVAGIAGVMLAFFAFTGGSEAVPVFTSSDPAALPASCSPFDSLCTSGRITFGSERDGNLEIYTMNADGSGDATRLTDNPGKDGDPAWSPDGTKIAFETDRHGEHFEIYVMNADGSELQRLTVSDTTATPFVNVEPAWSPDSSMLAFTSTRDGNAFIYTMLADGSDVQRVTAVPAQGPEWSPDGSQLAYFSLDASNNFDVWASDIDGSDATRLTTHAAIDTQPSWSPDGTLIAFQSDRDGNNEIYIMDADGSNPVRLTDNPADDTEPSWAPDGRRIVFRSSRGGNDDLYTMAMDGRGQVRLTSNLASDGQPAWSSGALPIEIRDPLAGEIAEEGAVDYFLLEAEEGVTYTIAVAPSTLSDVHLHLWRTASRAIKLTDVRGLGSTSAELSWRSSFTGPVFISVESYSDELGSYEITIEPAP